MTLKECKEFILENYYKQIGFDKENSYYSMKNQKKTKDLLLLATKLIKKCLILINLENTINDFGKTKPKNRFNDQK